jgi:ABC-type Zn uptake system ZnuABC Zn-binding protein ZnuA
MPWYFGMICKLTRTLGLLTALTVAAGCSNSAPPQKTGEDPRIRVLTTISTFNSLVDGVGGHRVLVDSLVPVGASAEDYQPTPADIEKLSKADVLVENGLGLEAWLERTVDNAKNSRLRIVVASAGLPHKGNNPHLWMDPELARGYIRNIRDALSLQEPRSKPVFAANAAASDGRLKRLQREIEGQVETIPPASRSMIIFHNAFQYYNDRFGIRTIGVIELSPGQEPNPQYINNLVKLARENHVRAVFSEPEYSPKLARALAESAGIKVVDNLYDDSIGTDPLVRGYESMLRYDTRVIVTALGGRP